MNATGQRCRVHAMRNALAHAGKNSRRVASAFMATAFTQDGAAAAKNAVALGRRPAQAQAAQALGLYGEAEADVLAYMSFPADHWSKLHSTGLRSVFAGAAGDATPKDSRSQRNRASRRGGQLVTRALSSWN
jgi:transposase-like protein